MKFLIIKTIHAISAPFQSALQKIIIDKIYITINIIDKIYIEY
jgi:hypothetical protein